MPLYVIIGHDVANSSAQRQQSRPAHVDRLLQLEAEGRLIIAGPTPIAHLSNQDQSTITSTVQDMSGSLIIAEFVSLEAVQTWVNDEPYLREGVYSHVDVRPFIQTLPKKTNS